MTLIAHVAILDDWESARNIGEYAVSTRGVPLDEAGCVRAIAVDDVDLVLERRFADARFDLLLVILDTDELTAGGLTVVEPAPGRFELHGPIETDGAAVVHVLPIERSATGYVLPDE